MAKVTEAIIDVIVAALPAWTKGDNIFIGPMRAKGDGIPGRATFVHDSGGPIPQSFLDGNSGDDLHEHAVQIMVRGGTDDQFDASETLAVDIQETVQKATVADSLWATVQQSHPIYSGEDEDGHPQWSINVVVARMQ